MGYAKEYGALLESIVEEADLIAMRYFRNQEMRVERKGDGSAVTQADEGVEVMARKKVTTSGIALDVLGEEMGGAEAQAASKSGRARLIIDPIDGTEEFSRGIPIFGTLLGIEKNGEIVAGMVSAPALGGGTRWWAYRGEGAYRNGRQIHVSNVSSMTEAMVFTTGTGPTKDAEARAQIRRMADGARNSRSIGGFWQHMLVAEGSIEGALDWTSKPWDLAPLGLIVEEAGGKATTITGERTIYSGALISSNGKLHEELLKLLSS
ncbi:MAG TPA: inositol monophosphatase family protein [Candidatus Dormibacteraeota bacterium]|nr:inositol monophosphatase family protein [Candidatus Dormibacteraeota bacterium]